MTLYPNGYGTSMITLASMESKHGGKMHPEYRRRFFAYIEAKGGLLGVGGGFRTTQPTKPGFAPDGKSFHQFQDFASGITGYAAVDLVVPVLGGAHRSPIWAETEDAPAWGLHTFISGEPWHIQSLDASGQIRGWQTWKNAGSPDPVAGFPLPGAPDTGDDMTILKTPVRLFDSRSMFGGDPVPTGEHDFEVPAGIPVSEAAMLTITAVSPSRMGYITVWANGARPEASCLNFHVDNIANTTSVGVVNRKFRLFNSATTHLVIDVVGYQ